MYNKNMFQEEFNKLVGENLAKYRKFNNYTQIALAEKIIEQRAIINRILSL
jgi:transcriptional regulator with XRE-family HTH domain